MAETEQKVDNRPAKEGRGGGGRPHERGGPGGPPRGDRRDERRGDDKRGDERRGDKRFEGPPEIDIEKLIADSCISTTRRTSSSAGCAIWIPAQRASCAVFTTRCAAPARAEEASGSTSL